MHVYLMFFTQLESDNILSEIADTEKEVIRYCGRILAEGEYFIQKIIKVEPETSTITDCELRLTNNELQLDVQELPF